MLQVNPDILGAQECEGREWDVAANIGSDYAVAGSASAGHAVIYRTSVFSFEGQGYATLNEMDQYGPVGELLQEPPPNIDRLIDRNPGADHCSSARLSTPT